MERLVKLHRRDFILFAASVSPLVGNALVAQAHAAEAAALKDGKRPRRILVLGDSLSAEYGLARGSGWVALLQKRLDAKKIDALVINASISGDTTSGGRARLPALLKEHQPDIVIIELGGNDALRGLALSATEANLVNMAQKAQKSGAEVLLVGMEVPPNYGADYTRRFAAVFGQAASASHSALVPFLLAGVADGPDAADIFQADRIHPLAKAHPRMLDNVWPALEKMLIQRPH
jgi:acyl-CoA thioesterase-1